MELIKALANCGWKIFATQGTHDFLKSHQVESQCIYKRGQEKQPRLSSFIKKGYFDLIINIPKGTGSNPTTDGFRIRRLSIDHYIPLITNLQNAQVFLSCLVELNLKSLLILPWQRFATISEKELTNRRIIK